MEKTIRKSSAEKKKNIKSKLAKKYNFKLIEGDRLPNGDERPSRAIIRELSKALKA